MNERQRRFAELYRLCGDAPAAAVRAGYSPPRAAALLKKPESAAAAGADRTDGPAAKDGAEGVSQTRIVRELARIAFDNADVRDGDRLRALEMLTKLLPPEGGDDGPPCGVVILPEVMAAEETR